MRSSTARLLDSVAEEHGTAATVRPDGKEATKSAEGGQSPTTRVTFFFWTSLVLVVGAYTIVSAHHLRNIWAGAPAVGYTGDEKLVEPSVAWRADLSKGAKTVCDTEDCQYMRWLLSVSLDKTKNPCDNFYAYVCGNLQREYPWWFASKYGVATSLMAVVQQNVTNEILKYLYRTRVPKSNHSAFQKVASYFQECLAEDAGDRNRAALLQYLRQNNMVLTGSDFDPLAVVFRFFMEQELGIILNIFVFFDAAKDADILGLVRSGFDDLRAERQQQGSQGRRRYIHNVLRVAGILTENNDTLVQSIMYAEQDLLDVQSAAASHGPDILESPFIQLGYLTNDTALGAQWVKLVDHYTEDRLPADVNVRVRRSTVALLASLFGNPTTIEKSVIRLYISWTFIEIIARNSGLLEKTTVEKCWGFVRYYFPNAVGAAVLFDTVNQSRIDAVKDMVQRLSSELRTSFRESDWMDGATGEKAAGKLDLMRHVYAYSPGLETRESLERFLEEYGDGTGAHVTNILHVDRITRRRRVKSMFAAAEGHSRNLLTIGDIVVVRASYSKFSNAMYISPTAMYRPGYIYGGPPEVNYGLLGRTLMHEMMHAFDDDGRQLDGRGRKVNWWTNASEAAFLERLQCEKKSVEQAPKERSFDQYPGEYLADIMGQQTLYRAYRKASRESNVTLGDVGYLTEDQIFFIAGCLPWCGDSLPLFSNHPPFDERCNVPLMNSLDFTEAFSCRLGTPMSPRNKCSFW